MFAVYVLRSQKNGKRYIGSTGKDPKIRLHEHNSGTNQFTRSNRPFTLLYSEEYSDKLFALKREKFLKSYQGRKWLDENV